MGTSAPTSEIELVAQRPACYPAAPLGRRRESAGSNFPTKVSAFQSLPSLSPFRTQSSRRLLME